MWGNKEIKKWNFFQKLEQSGQFPKLPQACCSSKDLLPLHILYEGSHPESGEPFVEEAFVPDVIATSCGCAWTKCLQKLEDVVGQSVGCKKRPSREDLCHHLETHSFEIFFGKPFVRDIWLLFPTRSHNLHPTDKSQFCTNFKLLNF